MAGEVQKIRDFLDKAHELWAKVSPVHEAAEAVIDPLQQYFKSSTGQVIKYADEGLLECVRLALTCQRYTQQFEAPGVQWRDTSWFIEEYTKAGVGNTEANKAALKKLQSLDDFLNTLLDMCKAGIELTAAIYALTLVSSGLDTVAQTTNKMAQDDATKRFKATQHNVAKFQPAVQQAVRLVAAML